MHRITRWIIPLFFVLVVVHLTALIVPFPQLSVVTKPVLVPLLALYFTGSGRGRRTRFRGLVLCALLFSAAGDTILLFPGNLAFLLGLSSFLLAHICYLSAFFSLIGTGKGWLLHRPVWAVPFLFYLAGMATVLWPGLPVVLRGPVLLYAGVISVMALSCLNLRTHIPSAVFNGLFAGVLLFLLSDSILAISRFRQDWVQFPASGALIMITYLSAQFLIATRSAQLQYSTFQASPRLR